MISLFIKYWRPILDVLLIVALVVFLFLWNPFNIFGGKAKLENTANMVSKIRSIGQLVTAEYYGEVITTYQDAKLEFFEEEESEEEAMANQLYQELKGKIISDYLDQMDTLEKLTRKSERKRFARGIAQGVNDAAFAFLDEYYFDTKENLADNLLMFLKKHKFDEKFKEKKFDLAYKQDGNSANVTKFWMDFRKAQINNLFREVKSYVDLDNERRWNAYLQEDLEDYGSYADFIKGFKESQLPKDDQKTQLALIGRGWVKAGFDFDKLDERNFVYDSDFKTLHFFQVNAKVLNADINPWFIPERKIPGFDILTDKRADFEKLKETKIHAIDKLEKKSLEAGIVETAQTNGEEALKSFFSLVTGEEIQHVVFHKDALIYEVEHILADTLISYDEIFTINQVVERNRELILNEENKAIKARRASLLRAFLLRLQHEGHMLLPNDSTKTLAYNYYNRHLPVVLQDSVISYEEFGLLNGLKHQVYVSEEDLSFNKTYPNGQEYWVSDSLAFLFEYNDFLAMLDQEVRTMYGSTNLDSTLTQIIYTNFPNDTSDTQIMSFDSLQALSQLQAYPITDQFKLTYTQLIDYTDSLPEALNFYSKTDVDSINSGIALAQFDVQDSTLYTTDSLDAQLFEFDRTGAYQVIATQVVQKDSLLTKYGETAILHANSLKKGTSVQIQYVPSIDPASLTKAQKEVYAIRSILIQKNQKVLSIGPVTRARDYLSRNIFNQNRREQVLEGIRDNAKTLRETVHKIGGR